MRPSETTEWAIDARELTKIYPPAGGWRRPAAEERPSLPSVNKVSLQVAHGELFGLLGPNGAGKTTLTKMLCTLISPTSGTAVVAGHPLAEGQAIRAAVGLVVTDERSFYWRLTVTQNLRFFAALHGLHGEAAAARIDHLLDGVQLTQVKGERFSTLSSGMRQRLAIARSLLHQPRILFLDEPTHSLDPAATRRIHDLILKLKEERQMTIVLITHDLAEAEKLCERVGVMHLGELRTAGSPAALRRALRRRLRYQIRLDHFPVELRAELEGIMPELTVERHGDKPVLSFYAAEEEPLLDRLLGMLRERGLRVLSVEGQPPSLDEVFQHYTQEGGGDPPA